MADAVAMKLAVSISASVRARSAFLFMVLIVYGVLVGFEEHWGTIVPVYSGSIRTAVPVADTRVM